MTVRQGDLLHCKFCQLGTTNLEQLHVHWSSCAAVSPSQPSLPPTRRVYPLGTATEEGGQALTVDKFTDDPDERLEYEFVLWCKHQAAVKTASHPLGTKPGEAWVFRQDMVDVVGVVNFALSNNLPSKATEEVVAVFKEVSEGKSSRLQQLPKTWRTVESKVVEGYGVKQSRQVQLACPSRAWTRLRQCPTCSRGVQRRPGGGAL